MYVKEKLLRGVARVSNNRRTTLRVRHAVRGQEQSRHELHPTVEGCFGRWLIEGHLEGAFYAVCVLLEEHRIVLLPVQVQQLHTSCPTATGQVWISISLQCSPTLDTLRRGRI